MPEKSAPSPPIEEAQTAEEAEVSIEQPMEPEIAIMVLVAVVSSPSTSPVIEYCTVAGPSVRVNTPGKPQSLSSVPGAHCNAYVVAVESDPTIEPTRDWESAPGMYREMVVLWAMARPARVRPEMSERVESIIEAFALKTVQEIQLIGICVKKSVERGA